MFNNKSKIRVLVFLTILSLFSGCFGNYNPVEKGNMSFEGEDVSEELISEFEENKYLNYLFLGNSIPENYSLATEKNKDIVSFGSTITSNPGKYSLKLEDNMITNIGFKPEDYALGIYVNEVNNSFFTVLVFDKTSLVDLNVSLSKWNYHILEADEFYILILEASSDGVKFAELYRYEFGAVFVTENVGVDISDFKDSFLKNFIIEKIEDGLIYIRSNVDNYKVDFSALGVDCDKISLTLKKGVHSYDLQSCDLENGKTYGIILDTIDGYFESTINVSSKSRE